MEETRGGGKIGCNHLAVLAIHERWARKLLPAASVKPYLLHEEKVLREHAARYFADSFSPDKELTPLILQSCEMYGERENVHLLVLASDFAQSEETMRAVLRRLPGVRDSTIAWHYNNIVASADVPLLFSLEREIFSTKNMLEESLARIRRRMEFSSLGTGKLWNDLLTYADVHRNHYVNQFDYQYGLDLVEALAKRGDFPGEDVIRCLQDAETFSDYAEIYMTNLAGQLKLHAAIPALVDKLRIDGDLICEEAAAALVKIGTDDVVRSVRDVFLAEEWSFKNYATGVLAGIKSPASEEALLELFPQETDIEIRTLLADGFCKLLSTRGFPYVQEMIDTGYMTIFLSLEESLYAACRITGVELPGLDEWKRIVEESERKEKSIFQDAFSETILKQSPVRVEKVGRNQPCPCGSGKKYKKCCGKA